MKTEPARIISQELAARPHAERAEFLRQLGAHVAAGILITEGAEAAAEALYRLADGIINREPA